MQNYVTQNKITISFTTLFFLIITIALMTYEKHSPAPIFQEASPVIACSPFPECIIFPSGDPDDDGKAIEFFQSIPESEEVLATDKKEKS